MRIRKNLAWFFVTNMLALFGSLIVSIYFLIIDKVDISNRLWVFIPILVVVVFTMLSTLGLMELTKSKNFYLSYDELQNEISEWKKEKELYQKYVLLIGKHEAAQMIGKDISAPRAKYLYDRLNEIKEKLSATKNTFDFKVFKARESEIIAFARKFPDIGDTIKELRKLEVVPKKEIEIVEGKTPFKD